MKKNNDYNSKIDNKLKPIDAIMKSLYIDEVKSISSDMIESGIDSFLESEVLQHIPIVKSVHSLAKVSFAIREKYLLAKTIVFIQTLNQGNANTEEIEKRKIAAENNEKWLQKEVELITFHLDRLDEVEKAKITAVFYVQYINQKISWGEYRELLAVVERVFYQDFIQLLDFHNASLEKKKVDEYISAGYDGGVVIKNIRQLKCERLLAVGLVQVQRSPVSNGIHSDYSLSSLGQKFADVLIKIKWNDDNL
ncbi:hypothetical protein [Aquibacillus albus]|uniref:DUF4393 domain-containing protein n=1 Tax=Aquibacillus albus TaxID=1168171 RepID=A0ABS2MZT6_9BACI|nr:hypothetical protein [Aquibacillus albus]MBM7571397.1 hypothetical protein [Aquibacillus albus]